jgi:hypothetical protein
MGSVGVDIAEVTYGEAETPSPGLELTLLQGASGIGEAVFRVRAAPSQVLPREAPSPAVELLVLEGGLEADGVAYLAGDFLSLEETPKALLTSSPSAGCVYLMTTHAPSGLEAE